MKDHGPISSESGAHDVVHPQRRATDCANHNDRLGVIEKWMYGLGGGMAVMAFFGMYAATNFFAATEKMGATSRDIAVILEKVTRTSVDVVEMKTEWRDLERRLSIAEKDIAGLKK